MKRHKKRRNILLGIFLCCLLLSGSIELRAEEAKLELSFKEQEYIAQKKSVKVAAMDNRSPFSDKEGDSFHGLAMDILNRFAEETGLEIIYVEAEDYEEAVKMTEDGRADITAMVIEYAYSHNEDNIEVTRYYLDSQMMLLYDKGTDLKSMQQYDMAEVAGYPRYTSNDAVTHMTFDTPEDCILAVRSGHADLMYCDIFTGMAYMWKYENRDLVSIPVNTRMLFKFGVSQEESDVLKELLDRTIVGISRREINDSLSYNQERATSRFSDFVYYYPFEIICILIVVAFLIVLSFVTYTRIKSRQSMALHGYEESYCLLADTLGEAGIRYDCAADKMAVFGTHAVKLSLPSEIENFTSYLEKEEKEISLTKAQFEQMIAEGMKGSAHDIEVSCRLSSGEWHHFRCIFSVITTDEAYQRPIGMIGCFVDKEEEFKEKERLLHMGMYDKLTDLYNRSGAEAVIRERVQSGKDKSKDVLVVLDVDFFKRFNDAYGHNCGDEVLSSMGEHLKQIFEKDDILCRWGGDEFFLYLPEAGRNLTLFQKRCEMLKKAMKGFRYRDSHLPITLSIGAAVVGNQSLDEAFQTADGQLYIVKEKGRDSMMIWQESAEAGKELQR